MKKRHNQGRWMRSTIFNSSLFLSSVTIFSLHAFEIRDYEKKIKTNYNITSATEKISRDALEKNLREFVASGRPSRFVGSAGHEKAREFIVEKLKSFKSKGASFEKSEFTPLPHKSLAPSMVKSLDLVKGKLGYNFIWEKTGTTHPLDVLILGANYDTYLNMPGADNNATGVAALLSMIEILDKLDLPKTVRIVFFDFEELGFLGSRDYVEKLKTQSKSQKILGYVNLVMLGNDSKREDKEKKFNNMKIYLRSSEKDSLGFAEDQKLLDLIQVPGKRLYGQIDFAPLGNGMNASSHVSFWEGGIPAICMSQNWESDFNPRFHTSNDFVETLNMNTYINAFRYITGAVLAWNYDVVK